MSGRFRWRRSAAVVAAVLLTCGVGGAWLDGSDEDELFIGAFGDLETQLVLDVARSRLLSEYGSGPSSDSSRTDLGRHRLALAEGWSELGGVALDQMTRMSCSDARAARTRVLQMTDDARDLVVGESGEVIGGRDVDNVRDRSAYLAFEAENLTATICVSG